MKLLEWSTLDSRPEHALGGKSQNTLGLKISSDQAAELERSLSDAWATKEELRLVLPDGWTLFMKQKDGSSRLLLAHPETNEWVGTLALASGEAEAFLASLREATASLGSIVLSELTSPDFLSNLDVRIEVGR